MFSKQEFETISVEGVYGVSNRVDASSSGPSGESHASHAEVLLDATATWLAQLPADLRPLELCRRHPKLGNRLAMAWMQRGVYRAYLHELASTRQGDGTTMSQAILLELSKLADYQDEVGADIPGCTGDESLRATTMAWLEQLPEQVRPAETVRCFPRIANKLCELWKRPSACDRYIDGLVVDNRGGRKGFPAKVAMELAEIRAYYSRLYPSDRDTWTDV